MIVKKIKPLFTKIVTTMEKYGADELIGNSLIDASKTQGTMKEIQKVISIGTSVRDIKVGDYVKINPMRYAVKRYEENSVKTDLMENKIIGFNIPQVDVDGHTYMLLEDRDIEYIIEEYEEDRPDSGLIIPDKSILS